MLPKNPSYHIYGILEIKNFQVGYQKQVLFLFPSKEASPLVDFLAKDFSKWDVTQLKEKDTMTEKLCSAFLLLVFDGTWQQAKEMVNASIQLLKECTIPVSLSKDISTLKAFFFNFFFLISGLFAF